MLEMLERLPRENAREYAARVLRYNIVNLNLKPGQYISENEICSQIGTSRTPVREALIQLSKEKMVEIYPQRGTCISLIDENMVEQARFLRSIVEQAVVEIACRDMTPLQLSKLEENLCLQEFYLKKQNRTQIIFLDNAFHQALYEAANKEAIYMMVGSVMTHFDRVRALSLESTKIDQLYHDHQFIFQAIQKGDAQRAKDVMQFHLSRVNIDLEVLEQKFPEYFK